MFDQFPEQWHDTFSRSAIELPLLLLKQTADGRRRGSAKEISLQMRCTVGAGLLWRLIPFSGRDALVQHDPRTVAHILLRVRALCTLVYVTLDRQHSTNPNSKLIRLPATFPAIPQ